MKKHILTTIFTTLMLGMVSCNKPAAPTPAPTPSPVLERIVLSGEYKTVYTVGDELDLTGLVVTAEYDDESSKLLTYNTGNEETDYTVTCNPFVTATPQVVTVKFKDKKATYTVTVNPLPDVKQDITISVNVSGIEAYEDGHAYIWFMSTMISETPGAYVTERMTQDSVNPNLWSITASQVIADAEYEYRFIYGGATYEEVDWDYGKHVYQADYDKNPVLYVEADLLTYTIDATFNVPTISEYKTIDFVVKPLIKSAYGQEGYQIPEKLYLWGYFSILNPTNVMLEKDSNGYWHKTLEVGLAAGKGTFKFTGVIGNSDSQVPADWSCKMGKWLSDGSFEVWDGYSIDITSESPEVFEFNVEFEESKLPEPVASSVVVDFTVEAVVKANSDAEEVALSENDFLAAWIEGEGNVVLGKGEDNKWHYAVTVALSNDGNGSFHVTFCLSTDPNNISSDAWGYHAGRYVDGTWENYENIEFAVTSESTSVEHKAIFQKDHTPAEVKYTVTFNLNLYEAPAATPKVTYGSNEWYNNHTWSDEMTYDEANSNSDNHRYYITLEFDSASFGFAFAFWNSDGNHYLGTVQYAGWVCTCTSTTATISIEANDMKYVGFNDFAFESTQGCTIA